MNNALLKKINHGFVWLMLAVIAVIVLLSATREWVIALERDSGVFMTIGSEILEGKIPYRDVWDHKPPLIFYINALGLFISGGDDWGVWLMQVGFMYGTLITGFYLLRNRFNLIAAISAGILFILVFRVVYENGNYTEQYGLLFQALALLIFVWDIDQPDSRKSLAIGAIGAGAFLLRQNLIGVWLALGIYWLGSFIIARDWQLFVKRSGGAIAGGMIPLVLVVIYFFVMGAFDEMVNAVFTYNFAHVNSTQIDPTLSQWFTALTAGFQETIIPELPFPPFMLMPIGWLIGLIAVFQVKTAQTRALITLTLILLPLEIGLGNLSGYNFLHYYVTWLPVFTLLLAIAIDSILLVLQTLAEKVLPLENEKLSLGLRSGAWAIQVGLVIFLLVTIAPDINTYLERRAEFPEKVLAKVPTFTAEYILNYTEADDYIFVWGAQSELHFYSKRRSPTRFYYQYALTKLGYPAEEATREVYSALQAHPPELIIDTRNLALPPLDADLYPSWQPRPGHGWNDELQPLLDFMNANYELEFEVASAWYIYRYNPPSSD